MNDRLALAPGPARPAPAVCAFRARPVGLGRPHKAAVVTFWCYVLATIVAILLGASVAWGGCPTTYSTYSYPSYSYFPGYSTSYYSTPTYYQAPTVVEKTVVKEVPVPYVAPVAFLYYGGMYSPGLAAAQMPKGGGSPDAQVPAASAQPDKLDQILSAVRDTSAKVDSIDGRLRSVEAWRQSVSQPQQPVPSAAPQQPPKKMKPAAEPAKQQGAYLSPGEVRREAMAYYGRACASCHEQATAKKNGGGFVLLQGGNKVELSARAKARMIEYVVSERRCPPEGHPQPTAREMLLVRADNQ